MISDLEATGDADGTATRSERAGDYLLAEIARGPAVVRITAQEHEGQRHVSQRAFHRAPDGVLIAAPLGPLLAPEAAERVIEALEEAAR